VILNKKEIRVILFIQERIFIFYLKKEIRVILFIQERIFIFYLG